MLEQAGSLDFSSSSVSTWDLHDGDELRGRQDHAQSRRRDVRCSVKQGGAMNGCCEDDAGRNVGPDQTRHTKRISSSTTRHGHRLEPSWQQSNMIREPARLSSVNPPNLHSNYQILQNLEPYLTPFASFTDDGETPRQVAAPKAAPAAAPKAAREVPGSKTPANNSNNNKTDSANRGGRAGYYNRGGPRNVLKGEGKTKPATDAEVTTVDPESGFEGERRGALRLLRSIHVCVGREHAELTRHGPRRSTLTAPGKNERGQARPRGHGEGSGRGRATRTRGRGQAPGAGYQGGERRNDGRRSAHALPDTEKRVASGWGAEDGAAELTGGSGT